MQQNLRRAVSNRGQWRDSYTLYAIPGGPIDPSRTVFTLNVWPVEDRAGGCDYGFRGPGRQNYALSASTDDGTNRLYVAAGEVPNSLVVTWLFPANAMRGLPAGSYEGGVAAWIADEMSEIGSFRFVVQDRGFGDAPLASVPEAVPAIPDDGNITVNVTIGGGLEG